MLLKGEKVRLRPAEPNDVKYLFKSFNSPESVGQYVNFVPFSWSGFETWVKEAASSPAQLTFLLIERNADKTTIGSVVHFFAHPIYKSMEIGYGIDEPTERGKGYASEAVSLLVDFLFSTKNIERIQATTNIGNVPSQRLLERCSFKREGQLRKCDFLNGAYSDALMYSIIREEWNKLKEHV
jgi:RimJ/RimL family protein N-acetyltransferase